MYHSNLYIGKKKRMCFFMVVINTIPKYENKREREASVQRVYIMLQKKISKERPQGDKKVM